MKLALTVLISLVLTAKLLAGTPVVPLTEAQSAKLRTFVKEYYANEEAAGDPEKRLTLEATIRIDAATLKVGNVGMFPSIVGRNAEGKIVSITCSPFAAVKEFDDTSALVKWDGKFLWLQNLPAGQMHSLHLIGLYNITSSTTHPLANNGKSPVFVIQYVPWESLLKP